MTDRPMMLSPSPVSACPARLQLSRRKGFDLQAVSQAANGLPAVSVARPSRWGNPFVVGQPSGHSFQDGGDPTPLIAALSAEQVVDFYDDLVRGFLRPEMHPVGHQWARDFRIHTGWNSYEAVRSLLRGKNLACWCALPALGEPDLCHAAVLLELANEGRP